MDTNWYLCVLLLCHTMTSSNRDYLFSLDFNFFHDDLAICQPTKGIGIEE